MHGERCKLPAAPPSRSGAETLTILVHLKKDVFVMWCYINRFFILKSEYWLLILYSGTVHELHRNRWGSLILFRFARPQYLAATHSSFPEIGNGLSWPMPQCTCWLLARHGTAQTREFYSVIQHVRCSKSNTCGCRDEESNPRHPGSEKWALPLGRCPSLVRIDSSKTSYRRTGE